MFTKSFFTTLLLAIAVSAIPTIIERSPVTLALSRRLNLTKSDNLLRHDQARAQQLRSMSLSSKDTDVPVINQAVIYTASVAVGNPPTNCKLILDPGVFGFSSF